MKGGEFFFGQLLFNSAESKLFLSSGADFIVLGFIVTSPRGTIID